MGPEMEALSVIIVIGAVRCDEIDPPDPRIKANPRPLETAVTWIAPPLDEMVPACTPAEAPEVGLVGPVPWTETVPNPAAVIMLPPRLATPHSKLPPLPVPV